MMITNIEDYTKSNGATDWDTYRRAQINAGEICSECGDFIVFAKGYSQVCGKCKMFKTEMDSVFHSSRIRCPKCGGIGPIEGLEDLYEEGDHTVYCKSCDAEFTVIAHISFTFESPAIEKENDQ